MHFSYTCAIFLQEVKVLFLIIYKNIYVQILFCISNESLVSLYIIYDQ